jgi:hypothetical protein
MIGVLSDVAFNLMVLGMLLSLHKRLRHMERKVDGRPSRPSP